LDSGRQVDRRIVSSQEVLRTSARLDPSQYSAMVQNMLRHMKQLGVPFIPVGESDAFCGVYLPNRFARAYMVGTTSGAPMLGTSSMLMVNPPRDRAIRLAEPFERSPLRVQEGDILISRSGTLGTSALSGSTTTAYIASDDCIRLRMHKSFRGYVAAYIRSPIGRALLVRNGHGKVIRHLKPDDVGRGRIPLVDSRLRSAINSAELKAVALVDKARVHLAAAEDQLVGFLGNPPRSRNWRRESCSFLEASSSAGGSRLDPHFFSPDATRLRGWLSAKKHWSLARIAAVWGVGRFKRHPASKTVGVPLYSSGDIMRARLCPSAYLSPSRNSSEISRCGIDAGTILIPCSGAFGGILGRAVLACKTLDGAVATQHVVRVKAHEPSLMTGYVAAFLASRTYGFPLLTSLRHGKDVPENSPDWAKRIPVPVISDVKVRAVSKSTIAAWDCVHMANKAWDKADVLMAKALNWPL